LVKTRFDTTSHQNIEIHLADYIAAIALFKLVGFHPYTDG
jgi:hypothetical protein